jgi:hypothetical protein
MTRAAATQRGTSCSPSGQQDRLSSRWLRHHGHLSSWMPTSDLPTPAEWHGGAGWHAAARMVDGHALRSSSPELDRI